MLRKLARKLKSERPVDRILAALKLHQYKGEEATRLLNEALGVEEDLYTRIEMASQLVSYGDASLIPDLISDIEALDKEGWLEWDNGPIIALSLSSHGEKILKQLRDYLNHENSTVRWIAIMAVGEMKIPDAEEVLRAALQHEDPILRRDAKDYLKLSHGSDEVVS
jgi:HEAT repeat protein